MNLKAEDVSMLCILGDLPSSSDITVVVDFDDIDAPEVIILLKNGKVLKEFPFDHTMLQGPLLKVLAQKYVFETVYSKDCARGPNDFDPVLFLID